MNTEIIAVTNVSGTTWTVTRGAESTTPVAHTAGFTVYQVVTAGVLGAYPQYYNVRSATYGAKGNGTADDTTAIQAAVTACINAGGGVVYLPAGTYKTTSTVTCSMGNTVTVVIWLDPGAVISFAGTGDCLRMYNPNSQSSGFFSHRSGVLGSGIINGTSAGAGSTGLHIGDIEAAQVAVSIEHFSGAGSKGLYVDNSVSWTEESDMRLILTDCTQHVVFEPTNGTESFGYGNYDFTIYATANSQDGVVLQNGAFLYHGSLRLRGNFPGGPAVTTAAAVRMTGVNTSGGPANGKLSNLEAMHVDWQLECGTGVHSPLTLFMDQSNFAFAYANYGILDFSFGSGSFTAGSLAPNQFVFTGIVEGDASLAAGGGAGRWQNISQPTVYNSNVPFVGAGSAFVNTQFADFSSFTLPSNVTVSLLGSQSATLGIPQKLTVVITQAAGSSFTVTWPHTVSPTTASPTVNWAGGTAPTMTAAHGAVDVYLLETIDGATWYGQAIQNVS